MAGFDSSSTEGGQGRQFDSSCDWPALPYSFFAPRGTPQRRLSLSPMPCHITAATLLPLHLYLSPFTSNQHTHFPSPPSFCFILRLLVKQRTVFTHSSLVIPILRNPNQAYPRNSDFPQTWFPHEAFTAQIGQFTLHNRSFSQVKHSSLGLHKRTCQPAGIPSIELYCLHSVGFLFFFCCAPVGWSGDGKEWNRSSLVRSKIMACGVVHVHWTRFPA